MTECGPVLIVDDDPPLRELLRTLLEGAGYTALLAESGDVALELVDENEPALVLLDVHMPGMSGYEVCRQLRQRFGEQLPVLFISGSRTDPEDKVAGLLLGADDYITKPFFPDEVVARVHRHLARAGAGNGGTARVATRLTEREHEVLDLLAAGQAQKAIAVELGISPKTVATHIQNIITKLGVHS